MRKFPQPAVDDETQLVMAPHGQSRILRALTAFSYMEGPMMAAAQRPARGGKAPGQDAALKRPGGRPQGEPSTIVNVRLPLTLLARLDRCLDRLEVQTRLKANRGMMARRAIELFLETHEVGNTR